VDGEQLTNDVNSSPIAAILLLQVPSDPTHMMDIWVVKKCYNKSELA
jgi:hypothetical protein